MRVLVVDDHPDTVEVMSVMLSWLGHEAQGVLRGRDALRVARELDFDIILLDIGLPDLGGYEVVQALRAQPKTSSRYIVAVTGWGGTQDAGRALRAGFDDHVIKPLTLDAIRSMLQRATAPRPAS